MFHSERMTQPGLPALRAFPQSPAVAAASMGGVPGMPQAPDAAAYTPLGQDVLREVQQFINQGGGAANALASPQASWLALQAARQAARKEGPERSSAVGGTQHGAETQDAQPGPPLRAEQLAFLERIGPWARQAAQRLGVSPRSVMAHAALESGWGQRPVRDAQGRDSLNLFGIKALSGWQGERVQAQTTEYENGQVVPQSQPFRQYADLDATFADYVRLLAHSPRYEAALRSGDDVQAFAGALAQGGYATDPQYAQKLVRISRQIPQ